MQINKLRIEKVDEGIIVNALTPKGWVQLHRNSYTNCCSEHIHEQHNCSVVNGGIEVETIGLPFVV